MTRINFDIDIMKLDELKAIIKMLVRLMNEEHDRVTLLQDRVLDLELKDEGARLKLALELGKLVAEEECQHYWEHFPIFLELQNGSTHEVKKISNQSICRKCGAAKE